MNLEELKKRKCPELLFIPLEIEDENVKWGSFIGSSHPSFEVDRRQETLRKNIVYVPTFSDEQLLGLQYVQTNKSGNIVHDSYCHFVDFIVDYKRAGIAKIIQRFGVKVFKKSEEKFLDPIVLETKEFCFFYDFKKKRWTYLNQPEPFFSDMRNEIETLRSTDEIRNIHRDYFYYRKLTSHEIERSILGNKYTYGEYLTRWGNLITYALSFHETKYLFGEISDFSFAKMEKKMLENITDLLSLKEKTKELGLLQSKRKTNRNKEENNLIELYSDLLNSLKKSIHTPGYWVKDGEIYPNICELYKLLQPAETNRNNQTKAVLKEKIIDQAKKDNKSFIPV